MIPRYRCKNIDCTNFGKVYTDYVNGRCSYCSESGELVDMVTKKAMTQNEMSLKYEPQLCPELEGYRSYVKIDDILFKIIDLKVDHKKDRVIFYISRYDWSTYCEAKGIKSN